MHECVTVLAPAKINLGLQVLPRRNDGFHSIRSLFTTVNLCDRITVSVSDKKNFCGVSCEGMALPSENTFTKAYKAFCVLTGVESGVSVEVTKHIPSGGGLGGGSSDASSFLQSIDTIFGTGLSETEFMKLSGEVGSDCFFFTKALLACKNAALFRPFAAFVEGRGEVVTELRARNDYSVLLVMPGVSVSTPLAYNLVDAAGTTALDRNFGIEDAAGLYAKDVLEWNFVNDFTLPVRGAFEKVNEALNDIGESGADFADMSGSGSTVFGVFSDAARARKALAVLQKKWRAVLV